MKYYGVPANMEELVINLKKGFLTDIRPDLKALIDQWNYYSTHAADTGASSVDYLRRAEEIKTRLEEDGADEIRNVIDYIRGNLQQVQELYPEIGFGQTEAYGAAEADYQEAIASLRQATAEGGEFYDLNEAVTGLIGRIRPRYDAYIASLPAPAPPTMSLAASGASGATFPSGQGASVQRGTSPERLGDLYSEEEEEEVETRGRANTPYRTYLGAKKSDVARQERNRASGRSRSPRDEEDTRAKQLVEEYEAAKTLRDMRKGGRGRATKKRRPKRAAKKTRKGKRGKVGRMSRKTRKTTRGRKAKKAKKTRKTRRHKRK